MMINHKYMKSVYICREIGKLLYTVSLEDLIKDPGKHLNEMECFSQKPGHQSYGELDSVDEFIWRTFQPAARGVQPAAWRG